MSHSNLTYGLLGLMLLAFVALFIVGDRLENAVRGRYPKKWAEIVGPDLGPSMGANPLKLLSASGSLRALGDTAVNKLIQWSYAWLAVFVLSLFILVLIK
jgi:hypothetical protein